MTRAPIHRVWSLKTSVRDAATVFATVADVERYPEFKRAFEAQAAGKVGVGNFAPPRVTGAIRYLDPALAPSEAQDFKAALAARAAAGGAGFTEAFLTAPSPWE